MGLIINPRGSEHGDDRDRACASVMGNDHHVGGLGYLREQFAMGMPLMLLDMHVGERRYLQGRPLPLRAGWVAFVVLSAVKTRAPASARVMRGRGSRSHHGRPDPAEERRPSDHLDELPLLLKVEEVVQDANGRHVDVVDADGYERRPTQDQSGATFVESVR